MLCTSLANALCLSCLLDGYATLLLLSTFVYACILLQKFSFFIVRKYVLKNNVLNRPQYSFCSY